jgi:hypothetical protein
MGIVTVISICLGVAVNFPVLGVTLGIVLAAAWIRASLAMRRWREIGGEPSLESYLTWVLCSAGIFLATFMVAVAASFSAFWAGFLGIGLIVNALLGEIEAIVYGVVAGILMGIVAGPAAAVWFAGRFWHIQVSLTPQPKPLARSLST